MSAQIFKSLKDFANEHNILLKDQKYIAEEASGNITRKLHYNKEQIKLNFDTLLDETQYETYRVYLKYEQEYGEKVFKALVEYLIESGELENISQMGEILGKYFKRFDSFFLSISQSRKVRAGKSFEAIHNALFKELKYPFDEQKV